MRLADLELGCTYKVPFPSNCQANKDCFFYAEKVLYTEAWKAAASSAERERLESDLEVGGRWLYAANETAAGVHEIAAVPSKDNDHRLREKNDVREFPGFPLKLDDTRRLYWSVNRYGQWEHTVPLSSIEGKVPVVFGPKPPQPLKGVFYCSQTYDEHFQTIEDERRAAMATGAAFPPEGQAPQRKRAATSRALSDPLGRMAKGGRSTSITVRVPIMPYLSANGRAPSSDAVKAAGTHRAPNPANRQRQDGDLEEVHLCSGVGGAILDGSNELLDVCEALRARLEAEGCYQDSGGSNSGTSAAEASSGGCSYGAQADRDCNSGASAAAGAATAAQRATAVLAGWRFVCTHSFDASNHPLATAAANHSPRGILGSIRVGELLMLLVLSEAMLAWLRGDNGARAGPAQASKRRRMEEAAAGEEEEGDAGEEEATAGAAPEWEVHDILAFRLSHNVKVEHGQTVRELKPEDCWIEMLVEWRYDADNPDHRRHWPDYPKDQYTWLSFHELKKGSAELLLKFMERVLDKEELLPRPGGPFIVVAGPPCQQLTGLNRGQRLLVLDKKNTKNYIVTIVLKIVQHLQAPYVLIEQVPDAHKREQGIWRRMVQTAIMNLRFNGNGVYQQSTGLIDAVGLGCSQRRPRLFIWGAAEGWPLPPFPRPEFARVVHMRNRPATDGPEDQRLVLLVTNFAGLLRSIPVAGEGSQVFPCQVVGDAISNLEGLPSCSMTIAAQAREPARPQQVALAQPPPPGTPSAEERWSIYHGAVAPALLALPRAVLWSFHKHMREQEPKQRQSQPKPGSVTQAAIDREVDEETFHKACALVAAEYASLSATEQVDAVVGCELVAQAVAAIESSLATAALDLEVVRGLLHKELHGPQEPHGQDLRSGAALRSGSHAHGRGCGNDGSRMAAAGGAAENGPGTSRGGAPAAAGPGAGAAGSGSGVLQAPGAAVLPTAAARAASGAAAPSLAPLARNVPLANHLPLPLPVEQAERVDLVPARDGACWLDVPDAKEGDKVLSCGAVTIPESFKSLSKAEKSLAYRRLASNGVSNTVCGNADVRKGNLHYSEARLCSPRELAALQGYPHHFVFVTCFSPFMKHLLNYTGIVSRVELLQSTISGLEWLLEMGPAALEGSDCHGSSGNTAGGLHPSKLKGAWQCARRVITEEHRLVGNSWAQPVTRAMGRCLMQAVAQQGRRRTGPSLRQVHVPDPVHHAAWQVAADRGLRSMQTELLGSEQEMQRAGSEEASEQDAFWKAESEAIDLTALSSEAAEESEEEAEEGEEEAEE